MIPAAALKQLIPKGTMGVGDVSEKNHTGIFSAMKALAASSANLRELWRASCPITTPLREISGCLTWMYLASPCDAWITVNEFMQEKPAAMRPRRPAVPNSMPTAWLDLVQNYISKPHTILEARCQFLEGFRIT